MAEMNPVYPVSSTTIVEDPAEKPEIDLYNSPAKGSPFRSWLLSTVLLAVAFATCFAGLNVKLDLLGLHGRNDVRIETVQRFSVYLMSYRFIPSNFDGLLLGDSQGAAYDTSAVHHYKIFNVAMRGASMSEEKIVAEQVLHRGSLKAVIIILDPRVFAPQSEKSAYMTPQDYWSSYGSLQTLMIDFTALSARLGRPQPVTYNNYGRTSFPVRMAAGPFTPFNAEQLSLDPVEVADLSTLLSDLHARNVKVYALFGPMYQPQFDAQKNNLLRWQSQVSALFSAQDTIIHLPADTERALQARRENFPDYAHMSAAATATVMDVIAQQVDKQ